MDGYDYDGKTYRVQMRVIIFDHTLAHDDIYKEIEKIHKDDREHQQKKIMDDYHAAQLHAQQIREKHNQLYEMMSDMIETSHAFSHLDTITLIAPHATLVHIAGENGFSPDLQPVYSQAKLDLSGPSLGPRSPVSDGTSDKAA
jgi:hypothetical protein